MEKRNKHWRILQRNKIYAARMRLEAAYGSYGNEFIVNGESIRNPRWIDLYKANWNPVYKSVHTPCSCWLCQGQKYDRSQYKTETRLTLAEDF